MRIGIQTWGSTGDIRPFVALAAGLTRAGHQVHLLVTDIDRRDYHHYGEEYGFRVSQVATPVFADVDALHAIGRRCIETRSLAAQSRIIFRETFLPAVAAMQTAARELVRDSELLIGHFFLYFLQALAEQAGKPYVTVALAPILAPSRHVCPPGAPDWGPAFNRLWWRLGRMLMNAMFLGDANAFRATLGLAPKRDQLTAVFANGKLDLIASSPSLFPPPPDWGINYRQCGYLDLPEGSRTDRIAPPLSDFMGAGPPPIFITFGSLMPMDGATLRAHWDIFAEALERSDQRAIVQLPTEWSGVLPDCVRILPVRFVSHRRVFAQCAMVVHHGGAGTTHAAIGAGVPSIVVPHLADQFFWGAQLHKLGVAPTPIPLRRLSAARLAAAIDAVVAAPSMRRRAADIARSMDREHGVTEAVRLIEAFATTQPAVRSSAASRSI